MNIKRLTQLKTLLLKVVSKKNFNINLWIDLDDLDTDISSIDELHKCGTTACAGGYAGLYPPFNEEGLYLDGDTPAYVINGKKYFGFDALEEFFDLDYTQAAFIFDRTAYKRVTPKDVTPKDVANHIDILISGE